MKQRWSKTMGLWYLKNNSYRFPGVIDQNFVVEACFLRMHFWIGKDSNYLSEISEKYDLNQNNLSGQSNNSNEIKLKTIHGEISSEHYFRAP